MLDRPSRSGDTVVFHLKTPYAPSSPSWGYWGSVVDLRTSPSPTAVRNGTEAESPGEPPREGQGAPDQIASGTGPFMLSRIDKSSTVVFERSTILGVPTRHGPAVSRSSEDGAPAS
jgi:ABC-type transport system substrate-binding protein